MKKLAPLEAIVWNIALPGFAQLLAGRYVKGIMFLFMEFLINVNSRFNEAIMLSFLGRTREAGNIVDYGWLMFYPCLYFFAMWDALFLTFQNSRKLTELPVRNLAGIMSSYLLFWRKEKDIPHNV
ncbi:UNVERIFIED_ORG: hypothetical protein ABRZ91_000836 [Heyndrickxia coagulans]